MNFIKGILGLKKQEEDKKNKEDREFALEQDMLDFSIKATIYQYDRETRERFVLRKDCDLQFDEDKEEELEYYLVLENGYKSSKDKNKKKDAEENDEYYFPILSSMDFKQFESKRSGNQFVFEYINLEFDLDEKSTIRIMIDVTSEADRVEALLFINMLQKLLYQEKNQRSYKEATNAELHSMITCLEKGTMQNDSMSSISMSSVSAASEYYQQKQKYQEEEKQEVDLLGSLTNKFDKIQINQSKGNRQSSQKEEVNLSEACNRDNLEQVLHKHMKENETQICNTAKYYLIDGNDQMQLVSEGVVFALKNEIQKPFVFRFSIFNSCDKKIYDRELNSEMNYHIDVRKNQLKWLHLDKNTGYGELLCLVFDAPNVALTVQFKISQLIYESNKQMSLGDCFKQQEEKEYVSQFIAPTNQTHKMEEEILDEYNEELDWQGDFSTIKYQNNNNNQQSQNPGAIAMDQAKILDRVFISKQGQVGVYKNVDSGNQSMDSIDHLMNLPILQTLGGQSLDPTKLQLMEQDTKMLIINNKFATDKQLYELDLGKGKIIREFQIDGINSIGDICPEQKLSEMTANPVFNCCNTKNLFKMDPRVSKAAVSQIKVEGKSYTGNNQFTCIATNAKGNVAVGNENGDIRLFDGIGKKAKCIYPTFGDEILSIDSTKDGKWLVATCEKYLILLPTFSNASQQLSGFNTSLKYSERRHPRQLKISVDDMRKYNIQRLSFTPARFDGSVNNKEEFIISSTGNLSVIWNFSSILRGKDDNYVIKPFSDQIKDIQFKFNQDNSVFATLPQEVRVQKTRKQKKFGNKK